MTPEGLLYPWKADVEKTKEELMRELNQLRTDMQNMQNTINNLRTFSQDLYDRLNISNSNYNSNPVNKVY